MLIGNSYKIEYRQLNITAYSLKGKKWEVIGYYSTLKSALKGLVDFGVNETALKDLKTIVAKQEELYTLIDTLKRS